MSKRWNRSMQQLAVGSLLAATIVQPVHALAESAPAEQTSTQASAAAKGADAGFSSALARMVPLRAVAEAIGAGVEWDAENRLVTVTRGIVKLSVKIGERNAKVDDSTTISMTEEAAIVNDTTLIPLETIREAFQVSIDWDDVNGLTVDPSDVTAAGSHFVSLLQNGQFQAASLMLSDKLRARLPEAKLAGYWTGNTGILGAPKRLLSLKREITAVHRNALLGYMTDKSTPLGIAVRFDANGKIDDIFLPLPPAGDYRKPEYDKPELYSEEEVTVGEGEAPLPGTLTLPKGEGPFPAVVLVHGSGPNDRDEALGSYKLFRDLAVGLAAKNIAVLRYEKRTRVHTLKSSFDPAFTVKEETVDDAVDAVRALEKDRRIDAKRIFVLGHSQGGMLVPAIIESDTQKNIAGAIVMAGPSRPLEDIILEQNKQALAWAKEAGQPTEGLERQVKAMEQQVALLKDPQYSASNVPNDFALGSPVWWFDFRNYRGGEIAKRQSTPLLVLQGDNDFQVTASNLDGWTSALSARRDVVSKLYPKLNHYFVESDLPSTGKEYALPGNVPSYVIDDIAGWLTGKN
ncbi:alpha/beta fold hydrolase [Paenibacillus ehimensis]|uniref:alpha/beta fold hydrolase n=1 Tax=Paenibacillus ehimensis TaxID=79264 RepID=UPI000FD9AE94|nr:alpha/beta fold hydrolase [Paenibacillus ehimensis]